MSRIEQEDNGKKGRFVIYVNDEEAGELTYAWAGSGKFIIDHTGVEDKFSGKGFGKQLVMKAVDFARNREVKILPLCPFTKRLFDIDKRFNDVDFRL
ncbi:GNAT family N-acetyltransferase [Algibacter mikhailovii]|uniref:GNAT family N-acetyltransferase n=1 Tax=Algibacter mikhailovii TaxID=425498 RepID=UPI002494611C|nr:GNAT family N-acetyltransferase [Algibacter mikhailovii]